ncbi:hypothetical protein B0H14DRAFT_2842555 [Mycena olivaceomarginata]|nr:hypothetical protein B0H14DRAFT_2842555 [Mycena olivaceomarginata]
MRASPPVFLFSLAFLYESSCFHVYFFDVPLFFRPLQIRRKNANDLILCLVQSASSGKEKWRMFIETWMQGRGVDGREEQDPEDE